MHFGRPIRCKLVLERLAKPGIGLRDPLLESDQRREDQMVRSATAPPMPMDWPKDDQRREER